MGKLTGEQISAFLTVATSYWENISHKKLMKDVQRESKSFSNNTFNQWHTPIQSILHTQRGLQSWEFTHKDEWRSQPCFPWVGLTLSSLDSSSHTSPSTSSMVALLRKTKRKTLKFLFPPQDIVWERNMYTLTLQTVIFSIDIPSGQHSMFWDIVMETHTSSWPHWRSLSIRICESQTQRLLFN